MARFYAEALRREYHRMCTDVREWKGRRRERDRTEPKVVDMRSTCDTSAAGLLADAKRQK